MPELTDNQIVDLRVLQHRCAGDGEIDVSGMPGLRWKMYLVRNVLDPSFGTPSRSRGPFSQFKMSLVGFDHVFATAQPVQLAPDLTLKVISSTALMLLKIVAFMDDPRRRVKDLDDIRGLLLQYEADSERLFSDVVIDAALQDFGLAPAFLMGLDLGALCADDEVQFVHTFLEAMNEANPAWMAFVRARGVGDHVEEDARAQLDTFRRAFDRNA